MNATTKNQIQELRRGRMSIRGIAAKLNLSRGAVEYNLDPEWRTTASAYQKQKRNNFRRRLIALRGSACELCGYIKSVSALDFHHLNPETKSFGISDKVRFGTSEEFFNECAEEIKKCILVCSNCHHEIHDGITKVADTMGAAPT